MSRSIYVGVPDGPREDRPREDRRYKLGRIVFMPFYLAVWAFLSSLILAMFAAVVTLRAVVIYKGWEWFVCPATNVQTPSFAVIAGLTVLLTALYDVEAKKEQFVFWKHKEKTPEEKEQSMALSANAILNQFFILGTMWLIHHYQDVINSWITLIL